MHMRCTAPRGQDERTNRRLLAICDWPGPAEHPPALRDHSHVPGSAGSAPCVLGRSNDRFLSRWRLGDGRTFEYIASNESEAMGTVHICPSGAWFASSNHVALHAAAACVWRHTRSAPLRVIAADLRTVRVHASPSVQFTAASQVRVAEEAVG